MSDRLRNLGLLQAVFHPDIQVTGQLSDLPRRDQRTDRDEAAIARRKSGAEPQVTKQNLRRVLYYARKFRSELLADPLSTIRFSGFVERQKVRRSSGKLVRRDLALGKHILGDGDRDMALPQPE